MKLAVVVGLLATCAGTLRADADPPPLRRGVNLGNWFSQSAVGDYRPAHLRGFITEADLRLIRSLGMDHVRFPVDPDLLWRGEDPAALHAEGLAEVDRVLDLAAKAGLMVVIDMHPTDAFKVKLRSEPGHVEAFAKFWSVLAAHLAKRDPATLVLEPMNEPEDKDAGHWPGTQRRLVAAIRAAAPRHTIVATGVKWSSIDGLLEVEPLDDANVIYAFHMYDPFTFTHQGATWVGDIYRAMRGVPYPSTPQNADAAAASYDHAKAAEYVRWYGEERWDRAKLVAHIGRVSDWAKRHGVRVWCGEFGAIVHAPTDDRARFLRDVRSVLEQHGIGWCMWDYRGMFALVKVDSGKARSIESLVEALGLEAPSPKP